MKKAALGIIALAMAFVTTATNAYGGEGDIRSINPCDSLGTVIENGSMASPYVAGETAYFRIRLENANSEDTWTSKIANPWQFEYAGISLDSRLQWAINPPKVGVYVSGQLRGANIYSISAPADAPWYTDIVCSYTVRPGDLALPMLLANSNGKEMGDGSANDYYLETIPKSASWKLVSYQRKSAAEWTTVVATNNCTFRFGESDFFGKTAVTADEAKAWKKDYSLLQAGLYLKSIDFASAEYSVAQGRTEKVTVNIIGGANTNGNGTVYAMVKKDGNVSLAEDAVETITFSNTPAREMDGTYEVAKVIIPSGEDATSFSFKVKGENKDLSETVYLLTSKSFAYGASGDPITNFVTAVVNCTKPPPPYISVTLDGAASKSVTSGPNFKDYASKLTVTLSEAYTSDFSVEVTPEMVSGVAANPFDSYIGMSSYSENGFTENTTVINFTAAEMADGVLSKDLYVYVLGADGETDGVGKGIKFAAKAQGAGSTYFVNENVSAILYIKKSTPQILYPTEGYEFSGLAGGVYSTFSFKIADDFSNMKGNFTVEWLKTGSGEPMVFNDVKINSDGEGVVSVRYNAGEYTTRFRVKNAAGVYSEYRTLKVSVNPAKQVSAVVTQPVDMDEFDETIGQVSIKFNLTEAYEDSTLYAFLLPQDEASSNLVTCTAFETGIAIKSGDKESTGTAKIKLLDGSELTSPLLYSIVLRTGKTLDKGEAIGIYESKDLELFVNNVAPKVLAVKMSGSADVTVNGGTFGGKASMGLNKIFKLEADDVAADLTADVLSVWTFSDPNGNATTYEIQKPLKDIVLTNVFEVAGTYSCSVKLQDKDEDMGPEFKFNVIVLNTPSISITFPNSETFNETDADKGLSYFNVELSTAATKPLTVELESTRVGIDGVLNIVTNLVYFRAGQMSQAVLVDELDGTANSVSFKGGFKVTAKVIDADANADGVLDTNEDGLLYSKVYLPAEQKMYVKNEAPTIVLPLDTGMTNDAAINVYIPIKWKIDDVDADRTNNLTVVWTTSEGLVQEFKGNDVFEGVFTNMFNAGGAKTVTMTVTDKDDSISSVTLYYRVSPSKRVNVYPMGPYDGGLTPLSRKYATAAGIGEGRVWGNGGSLLVQDFVHKYTYGFSDTIAEIHAWGYKNGQTDNGDLVAGRDIAIDKSGNSFKLGDVVQKENCYTYADRGDRDSFFYGWVIASIEEEATTYTGTSLIAPVSPRSSGRASQYTLSLPTEQSGDDARPVFADRFLEAFFAKELYSADNMGDMNADGVPDYYAMLYWSKPTGETMTIPEALTGQKIAGGDSEEGEAATASDLANISAYNDDLDFVPQAWTSSNPLDPSFRNWGPGQPFSTVREIRGFGNGLNEPGVSDYDLTPAETAALYAACAVAGAPAADYTAATNWAASNGWTPESVNPLSGARLNPLNADTDGDIFDDGWEYFFWYYSKIGAVTNGVWARLEGRRFDMTSPTLSTRIASEEIAAAFDPHIARSTEVAFGIDFDNDGLSDLEEFALGTNPCDWDSDGDGAADLWEVLNGLDPNSADGVLNPDCDFMARCEYAEDTFTLYTFANGRMFVLPTATESAVVPEAPATTGSYYKVEAAVGSETLVYWTAAKPVTYTADSVEYLAKSEESFASYQIEGVDYLGEATILAAGTKLVSVATDAVEVPAAMLPATGFAWTKPESLDRTTTDTALEVFNYGGDGATFVPATSNTTTWASVPVDVPVVSSKNKVKLTLIHNQVYNQYGFDPRVAWNINEYGFLDNRWRAQDSESEGSMGVAGVPTNTVAFTSADEFLLMQYRAKANSDYAMLNTSAALTVPDCIAYTTYPNLPVEFIAGLEYAYAPFVATNELYVSYWESLKKNITIHGADTDNDGVPDGWELYVGTDANYKFDGSKYADEDKLSLAQEFAGVDSCNAYTNRFDDAGNLVYPEVYSITKNNPGVNGGWWNKFFPTNPNEKDTDGDGLEDHEERDGYSGNFYVGRTIYNGTKFSFIYGDTAKNAEDGKSVCFRGGGLNPCTVDTDCDLLPDSWEYEFAGIVFENGGTKVPLSTTDQVTLLFADGLMPDVNTAADAPAVIIGGMDGTFAGDANYDYDHDGLLNCQEYLVQSLRHLRYDDALTPLMGVDPTTKKFVRFIPFSAWDGSAFQKKCNEYGFTGSGAWQFRKLGYFALPPYSWDQIALNSAGLNNCANYAHSEGAGYRVMLRPSIDDPLTGEPINATGYMTTDPRRWDSDDDGMDDYYEIFHGLNPILGSAVNPLEMSEKGDLNFRIYDVIASKYGSAVNAWANHWTGYSSAKQPAFDAIKHPWLIGTMECDADGDGLRNDEESLKVDLANPRSTHTDPTPLWMTDSTSKSFASFTAQYYNPDPYIEEIPMYSEVLTSPDIFWYPWKDLNRNTIVLAPGSGGINRNWMFSFEENEGFDTDHDFKRDTDELVAKVDPTSDPLDFMDPNRRQALYLPGNQSAAVSYDSEGRRSVGTEPDLLKQFTVECWACPEVAQKDVVIIERVCVYNGSTLQNNDQSIRANFRIGIDSDGCVYAEYEGTTVDSGAVRVKGPELKVGEWTHIAFRFDGNTAALHLNGEIAPSASLNGAGLIPATGIDGVLQETGNPVIPYTGYRALPCANILGARALTPNAVSVDETTTWNDFSSCYQGWIDEVRVWDGARTPSEIHADYLKRYTNEDVSAFRETVFKAWRNGATRSGATGIKLPSELLLHYNFSTLPGGSEPKNVIRTPAGFTSGVIDNVRKPNGVSLKTSLDVGWWTSLSGIKSTVYFDYTFVPWIPNTVAHLPMMDGSSADSRYWSTYASGVIANQDGYNYPNAANPYAGYVYRYEKLHALNKLLQAPMLRSYLYDENGIEMHKRYEFQLRSDFVGTTDLLPLGGAFAKRGANFWDGEGAMDAWTLTSVSYEPADANENGIPDWAEALGIITAEDYLRALADGLLPSSGQEVKDPNFKDLADVNHDGLIDWWQRQYDLKSTAQDDTDKDGLADFAEYLVSEVFEFGTISPVLARTNGKELDYFRKAGKLYLGELFSDHDFMEDDWENKFTDAYVDAAVYDPFADNDADGWSNYAECRARTLPNRFATITAEGQQIPDYPEPTITVKVDYKNAAAVNAPIVVRAYGNDEMATPDATWVVPGSAETKFDERVIGVNPGVKTKYTIGPGTVVPGTVYAHIMDPNELTVTDGVGVWGNSSTATWRMTLKETPIVGKTDIANITAGGENVGTINYVTGSVEIDFPSIQKYRFESNDTFSFYTPATNTYIRSNLSQSYFKIEWQSKRLLGESMWMFSLARATTGHVHEGLNTFEIFADLNGDGIYNSNEPLAVVKNVDVGWNGADIEVELKDTHAIPARFELGLDTEDTSISRNTSIAVKRYSVDGQVKNSYGSVKDANILSRNIGSRVYLNEGDFIGSGEYDIDWTSFDADVNKSTMVVNGKMGVTQVVYRVSIVSSATMESNTYDIVRIFTKDHLVPVPVDINHVNYGARPVFTWKFDEPGSETFTAFSVKIADSNGAEVWNSGFCAMPPKGANGYYTWKAPISINDLASAGKVFSNTNNYTWQISAHNSKFQSSTWSAPMGFRMNAYASEESNNTGRYGFDACVKYKGPGAFNVDSKNLAGIIRVEAYTTPDFKGVPAARMFITDEASVTNDSYEANVTFQGLESGTYYVAAFIDSDGDCNRSNWESWGYACPRGDIASLATFSPSAIEVGFGRSPKEVLYSEDTDVDQDTLPDVWEYTEAKGAENFLAQKGAPENVHNGYITVNPKLQSAIDNLINAGNTVGLLSVGGGRVPATLVSLALNLETAENTVDASTIGIKSISLENGDVVLTVGAAANEPSLGNAFVSDGKVYATIVVYYTDTLGGTWNSVEFDKVFDIAEGSVAGKFVVTKQELEAKNLDTSKGFFKVELK